MTDEEIIEKLRRQYVDKYREWDEDYDAFMAAVEARLGCVTSKLLQIAGGRPVTSRHPANDVQYYSIELALSARADRNRIGAEDIDNEGGSAIYAVMYCSSVLPIAEGRWHVFTLDAKGEKEAHSYDLLDDAWLSAHSEWSDVALKIADALTGCGWQLIGPTLTEQRPPSGWPPPLGSWDYQNGDYIIRDYIIRGMRDY